METQDTPAPPAPLINWDLAAATAARLTTAGPKLKTREIEQLVEELRAHADASVEHVHRITGLDAARGLRDSSVLVVDRSSWAKANIQSFQALLDPALRRLAETKGDKLSGSGAAIGGGVTGAEMGAILSFLASKVLGQYDPFAGLLRPGLPAGGRLLLVAPNIVEIERELNVEPDDFRLWVCLHEQTHRVQFAAAPWLRDHLRENIGALTSGLLDKADGLGERLKAAAREALDARAGRAPASSPEDAAGEGKGSGPALLTALQDPEDQAVMSHLTAVMSLLEGHANVVMDAVDASIVPSVKTIRRRFNQRGANRGPVETWLRRVLGLEAKMRQYADGQKFVAAVVKEVGMEGFNAVWERAENLPSERELHHPEEWVARVAR
ncbi:zinc-dependent metalloprotease [Zafaria sp. Z1313]|uniref:zinc-dependent metalloprotease n=1 Tax=unclassified Zafaria TaxID=2828765 RepID=UPI002E759D7F|nr:zinc-dependent metalloprotease [Zafaria sp. J156]MEE1621409.1 zinc-dependent metalloprotease [Zafaria sp. J156]